MPPYPKRQRIISAPALWFTPLHHAEWAHAIAQHVFRGVLSASEAQQMYARLEEDKAARHWLRAAIPEHALDRCADLGRRYGAKLGLRTLDSLHVACALELKAKRFWTFDGRQAKLAKAEGLKVV
ncbi:MAG TPA: type II toxin-antitoxin system VapC family toxin [Terriglobales bacterium]|nr:type II toxin-antitoxin system VapC family toxin [Terriglobales bacterium]